MRKYALNENFFENIDSEEKAYWLGFIAADGCWKGGVLQINLSSKDRDHLTKLAEALSFNGPIKDYPMMAQSGTYPRSRIAICSVKLSQDLISRFIDGIPVDYERDYWRGVVDGDGHIGLNGKKARIRLVGHKQTVEDFAIWVGNFIPTQAKIRPHSSIYSFEISGNIGAKNIIEKLYSSAIVALDRKQLIADNILSGNLKAQDVNSPWR